MKKIMASLLAISMCIAAAGCSKAGNSDSVSSDSVSAGKSSEPSSSKDEESYKPITIQFWNSWTGSDGQVLIEYVNKFNDTNKWGIHIDMDISSEFGDKITAAMAADTAPAMVLASASAKYDYEGKLSKLDGIWDKTDLKKDDFVSSYLDTLSTDDGLYGLPFQISSYVMYWNKDLFTAAGLDPEKPPKTYDEWSEYAKKITNPDKRVYGSGLSYSNIGGNACIMQMFGGLAVGEGSDGKWKANFAGNQGYEDFVDWFRLQFENGSNPTEEDIDSMFVANQIGLEITGAWLMADLNSYDINYGVTKMIETDEGGKQAPTNTQCFMVTTSADEEETLAAYRFLQWWHTGNDGDPIEDTAVFAWSDKIGYPTAYYPVAKSELYKKNVNLQAITNTDSTYCMDSVAPGNFRAWGAILTEPMMTFFNQMTFSKDISKSLEECQTAADKIISDEYGY